MFWRKKAPAPSASPPPPPVEPPEKDDEEDEPRDPRFWIERLAMRAARLQRLRDIKAPQNIVDQEHRLIEDAIARLRPEDALAAIARAAELASHFGREAGGGTRTEGETSPSN
jgi:hypothetical protein